jgi:hypothetical protein
MREMFVWKWIRDEQIINNNNNNNNKSQIKHNPLYSSRLSKPNKHQH